MPYSAIAFKCSHLACSWDNLPHYNGADYSMEGAIQDNEENL